MTPLYRYIQNTSRQDQKRKFLWYIIVTTLTIQNYKICADSCKRKTTSAKKRDTFKGKRNRIRTDFSVKTLKS